MTKEKTHKVRWVTETVPDPNDQSGAVSSRYSDDWEDMSKEEFLKLCEEYWDNFGTMLNDFDLLHVQIKREYKEESND